MEDKVEKRGLSEEEKLAALKDFAEGLEAKTVDMPGDFAKVINDNFWDLIGD